MESKRKLATLWVTICALIGLMVFMSYVLPEEKQRGLAGAEFLVS